MVLNWKDFKLRKCVVESAAFGVDISYMSEELENYSGKIVWAQLKSEYNLVRDAIGYFLFDQEARNVRYDYSNLFWNLLCRVSADARRFICSELVFWAGIKTGLLTNF
jgi:hypothetical protein